LRNELIKANYRIDELVDNAQAITDKLLSFIVPESIVRGETVLEQAGEVAAQAVIEKNTESIIRIAHDLVTKMQPVGQVQAEVKLFVVKMADLYVKDLTRAGEIAQGDIKSWAERSQAMGSTGIEQQVNRAWNEGTPPLFNDYYRRVKAATTAWHNGMFQGCMFLMQG
jgi:hypothetical protein